MTLELRRPGVWGPPAGFGLFFAVLVLGAPGVGSKIFYAVLTATTAYWFVRARRVGADITGEALTVRGQFRTRRFDLGRIREAVVEPMRTASPFAKQFPYVALAVELVDGRHVQFEELSAKQSERRRVDEFASAINGRLST